jgi:hypothetical protein
MEVGTMAYSGAYGQRQRQEPAGMAPAPSLPAQQKHTEGREPMMLQNILKKIEAIGMETDDLILALILFLMYRESGDKDLLIMLGAMLLS